MKYEKWVDLSGVRPEEVSPQNVMIRRDDSLAEGHTRRTTACCDRYYRVLLFLEEIPIGFANVVSTTVAENVHGMLYPDLIESGASDEDALAHINEFYPLFGFRGEALEKVKRRGVGTKVMDYVLGDLRSEGFRWAYASLGARAELRRLLQNFDFHGASIGGAEPVVYFKRLQ